MKKCKFNTFFRSHSRKFGVRSSNFAPNFKTTTKSTRMEAIVIKLENANVFEKIDRAIPYFAILTAAYFIGCWIYSIL